MAEFDSNFQQRRVPDDLLDRYLAGDHRGVWSVLQTSARQHPGDVRIVRAVAQETMARVARNADRLAASLADIGWHPFTGQMRAPQLGADGRELIGRMEEISSATTPLALRVFWEVVGGIDFVWDYDADADLPEIDVLHQYYDDLDPLCVYPVTVMQHELEDWEYERGACGMEDSEKFHIPLAPDHYQKANISGGGPCSVSSQSPTPDPIVCFAPIEEPFTDCLRRAFRWGGFPGLEQHADDPNVKRFVEPLAAQMEQF